jgi:hypothetical protein
LITSIRTFRTQFLVLKVRKIHVERRYRGDRKIELVRLMRLLMRIRAWKSAKTSVSEVPIPSFFIKTIG